MTILFDSGIRTGPDVFKAIALGAHAVMVGRLFVWGMSHEGDAGCRHVIKSLLAVRVLITCLCGCGSLAYTDVRSSTGSGHHHDRGGLSQHHGGRVPQQGCAQVQPARHTARPRRPCEVVNRCQQLHC